MTDKDTLEPHTPDSIFPNNWILCTKMEQLFSIRCLHEQRLGTQNDILETLQEKFDVKEIIDFWRQKRREICKGTGSMIFDHGHKLAYGSVSLVKYSEALLENL